MSEFTLEFIPVPDSVTSYFKLHIDNRCPIEDFWNEIEKAGNHAHELNVIQTVIERLAQKKPVSPNRFKELKHRSKKDDYRDYEIRTKHLRVYLFEDEEAGKIIVLGARKDPKKQKRDIARMRGIKLEYFESKNP